MIVERKDGSLWMLARTKDGISESHLHRQRHDMERAAAEHHSKCRARASSFVASHRANSSS